MYDLTTNSRETLRITVETDSDKKIANTISSLPKNNANPEKR